MTYDGEDSDIDFCIDRIFSEWSRYPILDAYPVTNIKFFQEFCSILIHNYGMNKDDVSNPDLFSRIYDKIKAKEAERVVQHQLAKIKECEVCNETSFLKYHNEVMVCQSCLTAISTPKMIKRKWWQK